jgi:hypothetical protein
MRRERNEELAAVIAETRWAQPKVGAAELVYVAG